MLCFFLIISSFWQKKLIFLTFLHCHRRTSRGWTSSSKWKGQTSWDYRSWNRTCCRSLKCGSVVVVSDHFDQIGSGTSFNERTGVAGDFLAGNLLRTLQKGFLLSKMRGRKKNLKKKIGFFFRFWQGGPYENWKKNRIFFPKNFTYAPFFRQ